MRIHSENSCGKGITRDGQAIDYSKMIVDLYEQCQLRFKVCNIHVIVVNALNPGVSDVCLV